MDKLELVKFRSLANKQGLDRVIETIKTSEFWCAKLWNMNDPMEGVYFTSNEEIIPSIFTEKNKKVICSLTDKKAVKKPLMWSYYANGFKGIAIETKVDSSDPISNEIKPVDYVEMNEIREFIQATQYPDIAREIVYKKLKCWKRENEFRFTTESAKETNIKIGKVQKVYIGDPYTDVDNYEDVVKNSKSLQCYLKYKESIEELCDQYPNIKVSYASLGESGRVLLRKKR